MEGLETLIHKHGVVGILKALAKKSRETLAQFPQDPRPFAVDAKAWCQKETLLLEHAADSLEEHIVKFKDLWPTEVEELFKHMVK